MSKGRNLGEFEILVLAAVMRLGPEAYGVAVREEIAARAARDVAIGAVYATLDRLEAKGLVTARLGEATARRGGRAKKYFDVTAEGARRLQESAAAMGRMLDGVVSWTARRAG
ncbi:PadR family transcriptional regulator [Marinicauda salina]|uniref:PadR family transcriptional regulator n=1 Tax=Marinicauda salina TaxID=2135793 RepID=UPI001E291D55|nr:helix-turn-helix transcriptional regulator [Marinicauda salina]